MAWANALVPIRALDSVAEATAALYPRLALTGTAVASIVAGDRIYLADAVLGQYLRGQLLVMLVLAVFYSVGLALFGLELALPIGIFTGLAIFVPYLGFGLGLVIDGDVGPVGVVALGSVADVLGDQAQRLVLAGRRRALPAGVEATITRDYGETAKHKSDELLYHMMLATLSVTLLVALALGMLLGTSGVVGAVPPDRLVVLNEFMYGHNSLAYAAGASGRLNAETGRVEKRKPDSGVTRAAQGDSVVNTRIISAGKAYLDLQEALRRLDLDLEQLGVRLYKPGLTWPLEPNRLAAFADDDYEVLVNPTGRFVVGGPPGDCGVTGRKIIVDRESGNILGVEPRARYDSHKLIEEFLLREKPCHQRIERLVR